MPKAKVIVTIDTSNNTVQTEVQGMTGPKCTDITAAFEKAMGGITHTEKKREYKVATTSNVNT